MKQSRRDPADSIPLKIRLPQPLQQQLAADAAGKPLSRFVSEQLHAGSFARTVEPEIPKVLFDATVLKLLEQDRHLALQYRDFYSVTHVLLRVAVLLAPTTALLRRPQLRSIDERFLEGARDKIRTAIAIIDNLPGVVADNTVTDAKADMIGTPSRQRISPVLLVGRHQRLASTRRPGQAADMSDSDASGGLCRAPNASDPELQPPYNLVEVKIRLSGILRRQLEADAIRNNRTLTAEIRARLELSCALGMFKRQVIQWIDETLGGAAAKAAELHRQRYALSTDGLYALVDALGTAQAILSPSSGFVRRVRPQSAAGLELKDVRRRIRTALAILETLPEATTEPAPETTATDTDKAAAPEAGPAPPAPAKTIKLRSPRS